MVRDDLTDEQLLERVVRGDTAAHEMLYDRYSSAAMGLALRIAGAISVGLGLFVMVEIGLVRGLF